VARDGCWRARPSAAPGSSSSRRLATVFV